MPCILFAKECDTNLIRHAQYHPRKQCQQHACPKQHALMVTNYVNTEYSGICLNSNPCHMNQNHIAFTVREWLLMPQRVSKHAANTITRNRLEHDKHQNTKMSQTRLNEHHLEYDKRSSLESIPVEIYCCSAKRLFMSKWTKGRSYAKTGGIAHQRAKQDRRVTEQRHDEIFH